MRQLVRQTRSLLLVREQAGWSPLQLVYLTVGDEEPCGLLMGRVPD